MKPATKILMMTSARDRRQERDYRDDRRSIEPEDRFRDSRGRERYNDGRYAPSGSYDSREYRPPVSYIPPVYEGRQSYREDDWRPINRIGFSFDGQMDRIPPEFGNEYRMDGTHHHMNEMSHRHGIQMAGYSSGSEHTPFTEETALEWVSRMKNADGSTGPHWTMEQTEQVRKQRSIECDPLKFYVTMNMMYSDYCKAAEKVNANSMDFYVYMTKAFLDDKDAQPDKLARYYHFIAKK